MPDGLRIERRKIRGAVSNGMLCSARELRLGESHEGIMELDVDVAPGTPFLDAMPVGDTRIVIDVLPNRADLLSHIGLAREIAAATGLALTLPPLPESPDVQARAATATNGVAPFKVVVDDPVGVPRFTGIEIRGVRIGPSPAWLVARIEAVGGRSINNVVDATNYVMHELGQPTHAFDADTLSGRTIVARRARPGETVVTLDGTERRLTPEMLVVADAEQAVAVGGIMGGRDTEVTAGTTNVYLEAANWDPRRIRATRRALGISTDASYRFERGVDVELAPFALERLVNVVLAVAGGTPSTHPADVLARAHEPAMLALRASRVAQVLGDPVPEEDIRRLLTAVGFGVRAGDAGTLVVQVPSWRPDVRREIDLVEEVARLRGYETFPDALRPYRPTAVPDDPLVATSRRLRDVLGAAGLLEVRPMPFVAGAEGTGQLRVQNPLAENEAHLRTSLLESLARRAEYNLRQMTGDVRLYEIGTAFLPDDAVRSPGGRALPREEVRVAVLVMGRRRPAHFTEPEPPAIDEWDAKAVAETILATAFAGRGATLVPHEGGDDALWRVEVDGTDAGVVRRVALDDPPVWAMPAFGVEVTIATMPSAPVARPGAHAHGAGPARPSPVTGAPFRALPTTPAAEFDLALLVPDDLTVARVEQVMRGAAGELLERLALLSEFRGGNVPDGQRSVAWRLTFRHPERTLGGKEIEGRRAQLLKRLDTELGLRPRQ
jgi:phenylalanyl-tRNA synthetase beta chain